MSCSYRFHLKLTPQQFQNFYQGSARNILVVSESGERLQIPASNFREFITANGIDDWFKIETDDNNKLLKLDRLS